MKKIIVLSVIVLFIGVGFQPVFANYNITIANEKQQPFNGSFYKTFGGNEEDSGKHVQQTTDGGYIITGITGHTSYGGYAWLIKTDSTGNIIWDKNLEAYQTNYHFCNCVQQTTDGGYIITGYNYFWADGDNDVWLIKTNSNGNKEWDRNFDKTENDRGNYVQQTTDGGYIITGKTSEFGAGNVVWLIKTGTGGNLLWEKTFALTGNDISFCVQQTTDGGYIIVGQTGDFGIYYNDIWMIKTDSSGNKEWDKTFGGKGIDSGVCVRQTTDGGYIITGKIDGEIGLIKTDSSGNKEWDKTYGGTCGYSVRQTTDGGYIITGGALLIKVDSIGNMTWKKTLPYDDNGLCVQQTTDDGYIITGDVKVGFFNRDVCLIKTDKDGNVRNKAVTSNMLLLRILERFPMLQRLLL